MTEQVTEVKLNPTGVDVSKLVAMSRARYSKNKARANDIGTGADIVLSDDDDDYIMSPEVVFWGPLTGIKGLPYGRIVQISGRSDSGKTSTAMLFMVAAQRANNLVIIWDVEKKFSSKRFSKMGGDPDSLVAIRSKTIQNGANEISQIIKNAKSMNPKVKILVVWDSIGATMNSAEDDDDDGDMSKQPGVAARENSWAIKKINNLIERYRDQETGKETISVLCINQVYANIGSVGYKEKGGDAIYYLSSIIIQLQRKSDLNRVKNKQKIKFGIVTRAKVKKNHLFDGQDCIAEMDLVISAAAIRTADAVKAKDVNNELEESSED